MNWADVAARIADLPNAFRRADPTFQAFETAVVSGLNRYTTAGDGLLLQTVFADANGKWLDVWGRLYGVPRNNGESDVNYRSRIAATVVAPRVTPNAIVSFLSLSVGATAEVGENLASGPGWTLTILNTVQDPGAVEVATLNARPAGVPFATATARGGTFLSTVNYLGRPRTAGAYLTTALNTSAPGIPVSTNNSLPTLGTAFLTDPTLNPSL